MALWKKLKFWSSPEKAEHLERGILGEEAARDFLKSKGMKFLAANFASRHGEIDLVFRDAECLVFVEVKTRTSGGWTRPAQAVDRRKREALVRTADEYLRLLKGMPVAYRFDIVEVLLEDGAVSEVRHIQNSFNRGMRSRPRR